MTVRRSNRTLMLGCNSFARFFRAMMLWFSYFDGSNNSFLLRMNTEFGQKVAFVQKDCFCVKEFYENPVKIGYFELLQADFSARRAKNWM